MQQPTQHIAMNLGDGTGHQGALFPNGLPHTSMPTDPLTSALSLLPPELLQSHQHPHIHHPFGHIASSQPGASPSLLAHVQNQLPPSAQNLLGQQPHGPQPQQTPLSDGQQSRQRTQQQRSSSQHLQPQPQQQQQQQPPQQRRSHQQQRLEPSSSQPGQQQGPSMRSQQGNVHLNTQQHQAPSQSQQPPNLAQLLGSNPAALGGSQPSLLQEHASILSDARSSVSSFSQSLHDAKHATPADRGDVRNVVAMLERASKALAAELDQGVAKLRALSNSPAYNNMAGLFNSAGANLHGQGSVSGQDLFSALNNFGPTGSGLQHQQQQQQQQQQQPNAGGLPFDLGMGFQQNQHANGIFNMNGPGSTDSPGSAPGGYNGGFSNDGGARGNGQQGAGAQNQPFLPALLAQYLSQSTDSSNRTGALSLFQSLAANGNANAPFPSSMQGLEALLNQGLPQQQQQQPSRGAMPEMDGNRLNSHQAAPAQLANGAPLSNAAALAALTSLGITPTMLEALGLGSVAQQMLDAPVDSGRKREESSKPSAAQVNRRSPDLRDESPEMDHSDPFSEPARKKRKQSRSKAIGSSHPVGAEAGAAKISSLTPDAQEPSSARSSHPAATPHGASAKASASAASHLDRSMASNPNNPNVAGPSDASKRIPTLGVGLRQEGDKRYRNRKLLRDLREHLYRWLGTDEFRKLRNTYKVAEWVPNPHLTDEEKQILASLPPGTVAQPPITTHIFHVDFTSRDFYRTNQSLIDAIVTEGSKKVEAKPEAYAIVPGTIDRDHLEDVAKDLMDSARSGFRMSLRTGLQAEKEDKEKHEKYRGVERAKTKCRNREIGAGRLRHAIPKQLLIPGAYSDDAASDEDLHGLTKSEWKRQRLRKLRIAKGWEAVTPKWRNKHLTRAYHKADIVSKSKQMARWRRDDPVDLPIPIKLYGKLLPKQLFDAEWLAEHRKELEDEPYCIRINDNEIEGWEEGHHPLGEDTSDEMEWSDAKESSMRGRQLIGASGRDRASTTQSPASRSSAAPPPASAGSASASKEVAADSKAGSASPVPAGLVALATAGKETPDALANTTPASAPAAAEDSATTKVALAVSEDSGTSSVASSSRSGVLDGGSDTDSDSSVVVTHAEENSETVAAAAKGSVTGDYAAAEPNTDDAAVVAEQDKVSDS
ncbi:hypothetical protein EX895_006508 [Sporisorium graminicola]|uniref:Uncharacterized protein n=1 Tax=Sporisorium graminicola TaxID=280036 RepID=A0A4U7KLD0_9BASI|nr:hypothetical protein EX895_006508 [Sporisorium graminicola]TKY84606.1 hypothetical protein EX895_006508 [Sporisorium graminicola]